MEDTDIIPPAVPLDLCLNHILERGSEYQAGVGIAIKLLSSIIQYVTPTRLALALWLINTIGQLIYPSLPDYISCRMSNRWSEPCRNPSEQRYRSANATKVLPRIVLNDDLGLWYVIRHAGFYKKNDRIICPEAIPLSQTQQIYSQLQKLHEQLSNLPSPVTSPTNPLSPAGTSPSSHADSGVDVSRRMTDGDDTTPIPNEASQQPLPASNHNQSQNDSTPPDSSPSPTSHVEQSQSPSSSQEGQAGRTPKKISEMTPEERKEYVQNLRRQKQQGGGS